MNSGHGRLVSLLTQVRRVGAILLISVGLLPLLHFSAVLAARGLDLRFTLTTPSLPGQGHTTRRSAWATGCRASATLCIMPRSARGGLDARLPNPLPWNERDPVLGNIKGDRSYTLENLALLLELVGEGVHKEHVITWPDFAAETTVGAAIRPIANSGILSREGAEIHPSTHGRRWLVERNPEHLIAIFHAHVRFIGEILNELSQKSMSTPALLKTARERYSFGWSTASPVFSRTKWLQAAGLVNSFSHKVHLSDKGRDFLARLEIHEPEADVSSPTDLQPAHGAIETRIAQLGQDQKVRSRAGSLYIPGVKSNNGQIDTLRTIVETCASATRDEALFSKAASIFGTSSVTAETGIRSLRLMGLIEKVSSTETAATPTGLAWEASNYPIDLARVIHTNIWYFGEIVQELETSGRLTFAEILERCSKYSLAGFYEPLKRSGLTARIALLEALGLVVNVSNNYYRATKLGGAFYRSVPCINSVETSPADTPQVAVPLDAAAGQSPELANHVELGQEPPTADRIAENLLRAARLSEKSVELELAAIEALSFLGLPATHIGGNERPDGIVRTRPGRLGAVLTVEAKSAASGAVPEEQAKPATLAYHRDQYDAGSTVYVGPTFERRLLDVLDNDERVAVVSTTVIAESVRRQVKTPLTPEELAPLVDPSLHEADRRSHLLVKWKAKEDWALCMRGVVEIASREAESPMSDEDTTASGVGWLDLTSIRRSLRDLLDREMARDVIEGVLKFLASPQVAVLEEENDRFRLKVTLESVSRHFSYLGHRWLVGDRLFKRDPA